MLAVAHAIPVSWSSMQTLWGLKRSASTNTPPTRGVYEDWRSHVRRHWGRKLKTGLLRLCSQKGAVIYGSLTHSPTVQGEDAGGAQYTLVGVVEHQGSMAGGHYISYSARLPSGQPAPPSTTGQSKEAPREASAPVAASASRKTAASGKSAQDGPVTNGKASEKAARGDGPVGDLEKDRARRAAAQLRESLGAGREKLDADKLLWFKASDAHVKVVSWEQVAVCEPYLLMYVRS